MSFFRQWNLLLLQSSHTSSFILYEYEALELFKKLPHLDYNKNVITDWGYTPNLYHFDGSWHVSWIHCEEGDSFIDFEAGTPEEAIKKAFDWCGELKLIENGTDK